MKPMIFLFLVLLAGGPIILHAQTPSSQDSKMVGIVAFSVDGGADSVSAKSINDMVSRVLTKTRRFVVLDVAEWRKTQDEIARQRGAAFLESKMVRKGKTMGAKVLVVGYIKNAEIYPQDNHYGARVDYDVKFIDVETARTLAEESFTGDSEKGTTAKSAATLAGVSKAMDPRGDGKAFSFGSALFSGMTGANKKVVRGKIMDAIESSAASLNSWVRNTFKFDINYLQSMDLDKRKGVQHVMIEGGDDMGMRVGTPLKVVEISEIIENGRTIKAERTIAELEIAEVNSETSICKVLSGGKDLIGNIKEKHWHIVFKS